MDPLGAEHLSFLVGTVCPHWLEVLLPLVPISGEAAGPRCSGRRSSFQDKHLTYYPLFGAAGVLVALSIVVLYLFLQKKFITGMLGGVATK